MEDNVYENVTSCLASSISQSFSPAARVGVFKTDLDIEVPSHYDVPRIAHRSHSMTALNTLTTHHQLNLESRSGSSSPLSDRSVEIHTTSTAGSYNLHNTSSSVRHHSSGGAAAVAAKCSGNCSTSEAEDMMSARDRSVYNSLGTSSSKEGKPSYALLGLTKNVIKSGIMSKTGPSPSWCAKWNRRVFVLKGNFLFYFDPVDKPLLSAPVLGGVYIKNSMIERISLPFTKRILRITPQVARRTGWTKHDHSEAFYIKFRTEEGRDEWYDALAKVSTGRAFSF